MTQTYEGARPEAILDLFLEVEFLHSLGCYTNARIQSKKIRKCDLGCGEALRRTAKLNRALDQERDNPKEEWRHPGPVHGTGVMLDNRDGTPDPDDADRIRLITDFYNAGQVALKYLLDPGEVEIPVHETGRRSLETLGECLFWERDPGSAVFGVNEDFVLRQKQLAESRAGEGEAPEATARVNAGSRQSRHDSQSGRKRSKMP